MLVFVKVLHTVVWAVFAGSIIALPFLALRRRFGAVVLITVIIVTEGVVLTMNHWRCPLTDLAARYPDDRRGDFGIYLLPWLARKNKAIFTPLFVINECLVLWCWKRPDS